MGQIEIAEILKKNYPKYLSCQEIMDKTIVSRTSILRCLRALRKRDEIEFVVVQSSKINTWITLYRIKLEG